MILTKIAVAVIAFTLIYAFIFRLISRAFMGSMTPKEQLDYAYFGKDPKWLDILSYIYTVLIILSVLSAVYLIVFWVFVA